jgi:hypothetical protein
MQAGHRMCDLVRDRGRLARGRVYVDLDEPAQRAHFRVEAVLADSEEAKPVDNACSPHPLKANADADHIWE